MKKLLAFSIIFLLALASSTAQVKLKLNVHASIREDSVSIYVSGNQPEFGNWHPGKVHLDRISDSLWTKEFIFQAGTLLEFKLTKGSWDTEALNDNAGIPGNMVIRVLSDTIISIRINKWKNSRSDIRGLVTGKVVKHSNFKGREVEPRDVVVWLPPDYDSATDKYYPVLYMHDGQNIFDPSTSSFGIDWQIDETADSLIRSGSIKEVIIVGIYNTYKRRTEYVNTEDGYAYIRFIVEELKPFIDNNYRTLPDKENTAVGGSSLGGLISFIMVWEYPDVFSGAACLSPAFKMGEIDYVSSVNNYGGDKKAIRIYLDNGGTGLDQRLQYGVDEMLEALQVKGYLDGYDIYWYQDKTAEHNESAWAKRVWRFLKFLFPG